MKGLTFRLSDLTKAFNCCCNARSHNTSEIPIDPIYRSGWNSFANKIANTNSDDDDHTQCKKA